jgi:hypothetical protein
MNGNHSAGETAPYWIQERPRRPGPAEAWVLPYGVPIWILIAHLRMEDWNVELVAEAHRMPREAVRATVDYYRRHSDAIDQQIALSYGLSTLPQGTGRAFTTMPRSCARTRFYAPDPRS